MPFLEEIVRRELSAPAEVVIVRCFATGRVTTEEQMVARHVEGGQVLDLDPAEACDEPFLSTGRTIQAQGPIGFVVRSNALRAERTGHQLGLCTHALPQGSMALRELAPLPALRFWTGKEWTMRPEWTDADRLRGYIDRYRDEIYRFVESFEQALLFGLDKLKDRADGHLVMIAHEPHLTFGVMCCIGKYRDLLTLPEALLTNGGVGKFTIRPDGTCAWEKLL